MDEKKLDAILDAVFDRHSFNHNGTCECGAFTGKSPASIQDHIKHEIKLAFWAMAII